MIQKVKKAVNDPELLRRYIAHRYIRPVRTAWGLTRSTRWNRGTHVYDLDWDLLIVLDTCRPDALREVAAEGEYDFLEPDGVDEIQSVASATFEWVGLTFDKEHQEEVADTGFVSANGWPHRVLAEGYDIDSRYNAEFAPTAWDTLDDRDLGEHVRAWQYGEGRAGFAEQPQADAKTVTDLAVDMGRRTDYGWYIVHYIEPHYPFAAAARNRGAEELNDIEQNPFEYLCETGDRETVWELYLDELRFALDNVETLLKNFDADLVAITADHGEAFGERGYYAHQPAIHTPSMRTVPLAWTEASDSGEYSPDTDRAQHERDVAEHLESLGYV